MRTLTGFCEMFSLENLPHVYMVMSPKSRFSQTGIRHDMVYLHAIRNRLLANLI